MMQGGAADELAGEVTLIFPAGLPDSRRHRAEAVAAGVRVVGASSLAYDPASADYGAWERLPYVHEPSFPASLASAAARHGITSVYTPHAVAADVLAGLLPAMDPPIRLVRADPVREIEDAYREREDTAATRSEAPWAGRARQRPAMPAAKLAGVLRLVDGIPGMTDHDKADALVEAMRDAPWGDVVEIGSWWGRSAALLLLLARHHGIGPLLCVDPWDQGRLAQGVEALDRASAKADADAAFRIFLANLSPLAAGDANYLRAPSSDAAAAYGAELRVDTEHFGFTRYGGRIALLHIDGNHGAESVAEDVRLWTPHVQPGGWIVLDDYEWAFGDGPRQAGDAFLEREHARIDSAFVTGTALFIKLAETT